MVMDDEAFASPGGADQPLGAILKELRRSRKLSGKALGELAGGISQSKISRIESGAIRTVDPDELRSIARALRVPQDVEEALVRRAYRVHDQMSDSRRPLEGVAGRQHIIAQLEESTSIFRTFQPAVVVGLLQTSSYAEAVLSMSQSLVSGTDPETPATVAAALSERVRRQELLVRLDRTFHFIMSETVLENQLCSPIFMAAQIEHLRSTATRGNVFVRFVPKEVQWNVAPMHGFELLDDSCVTVDLSNTSLTSRGDADIALYKELFDRLEKLSTPDIEPILTEYHRYYSTKQP